MANNDVLNLRHCYAVGDERMCNSYWYLEQGDIPFEVPAQLLASQWEVHILPLLQAMWGVTCHSLYVYARRVFQGRDIPGLKETGGVGDVLANCVPTSAAVQITTYSEANQHVFRATQRLGGLSTTLQADGVLTSPGFVLAKAIADRMLIRIPYTGSSGIGWYPGIYTHQAEWVDALHIVARHRLGSQRTRIRGWGSLPGAIP
jgi:hypothetical protein